MTDAVLEHWSDSRRAAFVRFWNATFADRPNFVPLTEVWWRERVEARVNQPVEPFAPEDLLLATEGEEVVGMIHVGRRPEDLARLCYPDWKGGAQGYVACLAVRPDRRKRGLASRLWEEAMLLLPQGSAPMVDGQCFNPFYGNSEYPSAPFWGTPEGISVLWDDATTIEFFRRRGHGPRFKALTLEANLRALPPIALKAVPPNLRVELRENLHVTLGIELEEAVEEPRGIFATVLLLEGNSIRGYLQGMPLKEVARDLGAIHEMQIDEAWQGRGLGGQLLKSFFKYMKEMDIRRIQTVTVPNLSPNAVQFYERHGFSLQHEWAIF